MNAKLIMRVFVIVLVTLGLTALVAAQAQPGAPIKAAPADELGESGSPAANKSEIEPNNDTINADWLVMGDVIAGKIDSPGDVDYYALATPSGYLELMADIDAQMNGSPLDAKICLLKGDGVTVQTCSDDSNGVDPMVWGAVWWTEGPAYLRVKAYDANVGGAAYTYRLAVYRPLFVSPAKGGTVAGIKFQAADVLSHYDFADGTEKWMLFFDASDVDITKNVAVLHADPGYTTKIVLGLSATQSMWIGSDGVHPVTPYDTIAFQYGATESSSGSLGPNTVGYFEFFYNYKPEGLTAAGEKIDALADWFEFSTTGAAKFPANGLKTQDEDIVFAAYAAGYLEFDGSLIPGLAAEDVVGADQGDGDLYYLTIKGSGRIDGRTFTEKDIFVVDSVTNHVVAPYLYWHGPDHHFNYNIDAIDVMK